MLTKEGRRKRRHLRIRKDVFGTSERPRLVIHRSLKHLYVQVVNDEAQKTLYAFSTNSKPFREKVKKGGTVAAATDLGDWIAREAKEKGIAKVVFDRAGYLYHGRVKALAEACRKGGLDF